MYGRILDIDLTTGTTGASAIPADWVRQYVGGSGLGARLLADDLRHDPFDPASPLLFITGPLTGTGGPTTGRFTICGRSPQTGLWAEANIGGFVGPELRMAGYDAVRIRGRAAEPVYLWIHAGEVELRPAGHLWGQSDTFQTQSRIRAELGQPQAKVACIGLAGENRVLYAAILSDHGRLAARTGLGAVMGSKNLKALAVRGDGPVPVSDSYRKLRVASNKTLLEQNMTSMLNQVGTSGSAEYLNYMGDMPVRSWTQAMFDGAGAVSGTTMAETILTGSTGCQGCVIRCGREVHVPAGPYATPPKSKGPEYETLCAFGPMLLIDDLAAITALGQRCDELGLDTISAGSTISLATLLWERGILSSADTGGLELAWGDPRPAFTLLEQIATRSGFGALLADGALALAERFGVPELAVVAHKLEFPMHDPRAFQGQALAYVTSPRGACHNQSDFFTVELGGTLEEIGIPATDRFEAAGKAQYVARHQFWRTACNNLTICFFAVVSPVEVAELLSAQTGEDWTVERLLEAGERSWNRKRLINLELGWRVEDEKLPKLLTEPLPDGGQEGRLPDLETMLREYYAACGWDRATGRPLPETLQRLGI